MKLSDQIEQMRLKMNEAADEATDLVTGLHRSMLARDAELIKQIDDMIAMQTENASTIVNGLMTIASRYGQLPTMRPSPAQQPAKVAAPPGPSPLPPGGARPPSWARGGPPPLPPVAPNLAHATINEILAGAGDDARH